jgi:hypothetical protein
MAYEEKLSDLSEWVTESLEKSRAKEATASLFDGPSDDEKVVQDFLYRQKEDPTDFARMIWVRAERYAHGMEAKVSFQLVIDGVNGIYAFSIDGRSEEDDEGPQAPPEVPDELGKSGKLLVGIALDAMTASIGQLQDMVRETNQRWEKIHQQDQMTIRQFSSERAGVMTLFGELADNKAKRDLEIRREQKKDDRKDAIVGMLGPIGMGMVQKMMTAHASSATGGSPASHGANDGSVVGDLKAIAEDLSGEQLAQLKTVLTQKQMQGLLGLMTKLTASSEGEPEGSPVQ